MAEYHVASWNIEDHQPRQSFEVMAAPQPGELAIRPGVRPGLLGEKDIYIRRYGRRIGLDQVHLVTYTYQELNPRQVRHLVYQAFKFAQEQN